MSDNAQTPVTGQPSVAPENFWDAVEENVVKANSGGGGYWGGFEVLWCVKIFPKKEVADAHGLDQVASVFPYDPQDKPGREAAFAKAKDAIVKYGIETKPFAGVAFLMRKANMLNKPEAKGDALFFTMAFKNRIDKDGTEILADYESTVLPKLREFNLPGGTDKDGNNIVYWGHLNFVAGHSKRKDGSDNLVCYPDAVYPDRDTCIAAMGVEASPNKSAVAIIAPDGFDAASWAAVLPDIQNEFTVNKKNHVIVARTWGIPVETALAIKESLV